MFKKSANFKHEKTLIFISNTSLKADLVCKHRALSIWSSENYHCSCCAVLDGFRAKCHIRPTQFCPVKQIKDSRF